jgi:hypothetical protein
MLKVKLAFPVLFRVTVCAALVVPTFWLLKVRLEGVTPAKGALPVPERVTVCVVPATLLLLSVMVREAVRLPMAVAVNVTLRVQLPPAASEPPQVLVSPKSPGLAPVNAMPLMDKATFPVLFKVTVCAALVVPTFWELKVRLEVVRLATGAVTVRVVEPCTAPEAPVIVVLPKLSPLASPPAVIAATAGSEEVQVTEEVKFWVLVSL